MPTPLISRRDLLGSAIAAGALWAAGCAGAGATGIATPATLPDASLLKPLFFPVALTGPENVAAEAGFNCLATGTDDLLRPAESDAEFEAGLRTRRMPVRACNLLVPRSLRITGPAPAHDAIVARCAVAFRRARRAGVGRFILGSGGARQVPDGFPMKEATAQFTALLRRLAPVAAEHGVLVIPETLNHRECNFITRLPELTAIVAEVNHPSVRMNADLYHMRTEGDDPAMLAEALPWLAHVEIAEKARRTVPGVDGDDFRPFLRVLAKAGWSGMLNVEPGVEPTVADCRRMFRTLEAQIRESMP